MGGFTRRSNRCLLVSNSWPMNASIAVIIPAFNAAEYIGETLDSVFRQTRRPDELIVVDDGSTDATPRTVRDWQEAHPALASRLLQQANSGPSAARNRALRSTAADFVAFLDSDDLMLPNHLRSLERAMTSGEGIGLAFGDQCLFSEAGVSVASFLADKRILRLPTEVLAPDVHVIGESPYRALVWGNQIPMSGQLIRHTALDAAGPFDESLSYSEDRDLMLRLSRVCRFAYIHEHVARKREHANNLTHDRHALRQQESAFRMLTQSLARASTLGLGQAEIAETKAALGEAAYCHAMAAARAGVVPALRAIAQQRAAGWRPVGQHGKALAKSLIKRRRTVSAENPPTAEG